MKLPTASEVQAISGVGLSGTINHQNIKIVTASYLMKQKGAFDQEQFNQLAGEGNSVSYLMIEETVIGLIAQGDKIKENAYQFIKELLDRGIQPVMLTGDNQAAAKMVADKVGIQTFYANLLPEEKEKMVARYQQKEKTVMMLGDGVNDAPSLAKADVGIAIGAGTDIAIDSADVILVKSDPLDTLHFLSLAKNTTRKMIENLWWGAGYNIIAIPLAAGILAPIGIVLSPAVGSVLMSLSTVVVAFNALLLKIDH